MNRKHAINTFIKRSLAAALAALIMLPAAAGAEAAAQSGKDAILASRHLYELRLYAGTGEMEWRDGAASQAAFRGPSALLPYKGGLLVADAGNQRIRSIQDGKVTTRVGQDLGTDGLGLLMGALHDGTKGEAMFQTPAGMGAAPDGSVVIADVDNHAIRRLDATGKVTTIAGDGRIGLRDGKAEGARFHHPQAVAVASDGTIYVADTLNHVIRRIQDGQVTTLNAAASRAIEYFPGVADMAGDYEDGPLASAKFNEPSGLALDQQGNLYVSDTGNQRIRYIDLSRGTVTTVAGGSQVVYERNAAYAEGGYADGLAHNARFRAPRGLAVTPSGGLLIADSLNHAIRYLADGQVTTLAGVAGEAGSLDGIAAYASLKRPVDVAVLADGTIAIADLGNNLVRTLAPYTPPAGFTAGDTVQLLYNQTIIRSDIAPVIRKGTTFVPLRVLAEKLGYEVNYTGGAASISREGVVYTVKEGSNQIVKRIAGKQAETVQLQAAVTVSSGRMLVPVRFFAEEAGLDVQWLGSQNAVLVRERYSK